MTGTWKKNEAQVALRDEICKRRVNIIVKLDRLRELVREYGCEGELKMNHTSSLELCEKNVNNALSSLME